MTTQKTADARPNQAIGAGSASPIRKPWKKKTPIDVVLEQIDRLRDQVNGKEEELKQAKKQLQKLEEVRKVLETT